jgi:hypothetical protein
MATTPTFDPIFKEYLTGNVVNIKVYDPDDTENSVLPLGEKWKVEILWHLFGNYVTALGGKWDILLTVESMGSQEEKTLISDTKDFLAVEPGSTRKHRDWKYTYTVPADAIKEKGVYRLTVFINYVDTLGAPMPMAGHLDEPLISFYEPEP